MQTLSKGLTTSRQVQVVRSSEVGRGRGRRLADGDGAGPGGGRVYLDDRVPWQTIWLHRRFAAPRWQLLGAQLLTLTPYLYGGLAKLNPDPAQDVAQCYGIRGIPAVKGFVGGQVVAEFTGVRSRPEVQEWLQQLGPSPADDAVAAAEAALVSGDTDAARQHLRYALAHDGGHAAAATLLARTLAESGDDAAFQALLAQLPAATRAEVQRRLGPIRYALHVAARGGEAAVEARASAAPTDPAARFDAAMLQVARGDVDGALGALLALVRSDRSWGDDAARKALLELLPLHPGGDAGARRWRKKLAMALF